MLIQIKQKISIDCIYLDDNIQENLLNKLKKTVVGNCSLEYGYILNIIKIINMSNNKISSADSLCVFDVVYEAEILKPEIGNVFSGKVCMVFQSGFMVDIQNIIKVLIPVSSLKDFVYKEDNQTFLSKDKLIIKEGVELNIEIVMIKYEKKKYSCIGKIKK